MDSTSWGWNYPGGPGGPPPPLPPSNSNPPLPPDQPLPPLPTGGDSLNDAKKVLPDNTANPSNNFYGAGTPSDWQQNYGNWNQNSYGNWPNTANNNWSGYGQGPWSSGPPPSGQDTTNYNAWNQYWNAGNQNQVQIPPGPAVPDQSGKKIDSEFDESKDPELIEFDAQFKTWEQQFEKWREDNKDHPDKSALTKYEETWTKWRDELLTKRKEIKKTKLEQFKIGSDSASKKKPEVASSGIVPNQAWGSTDTSQQPWTPNSNQPWGQGQSSGPNWTPQLNSGQGPVPDNTAQGQQGWSSAGPNQGQGWGPNGPNQGQGWGPNGPNQGQGWGANGPNQGQGWGPNGPNQGQGWGPHGPNQGQGWGPNGPNQGQGWGPNGPNQGQGWGPNGPNQGQGNDSSGSNQGQGWGPNGPNQGWGPPPGFSRPPNQGSGGPPNIGPGGPSNIGPGGPPNIGPGGGPPNIGPGGGPPNIGPGGGPPNIGPGGPPPNQGPGGPPNQGLGGPPPNQGLGGPPPNQGPGGGPPNQGPGSGPNQGSSWGQNAQNQQSGWGPNGPNQSQWGPNGPNQSQWGPPSGPNQGQGGPPSGPNQGQGGPPSGPNQGQGGPPSGPNQGQGGPPSGPNQGQGGPPSGPNQGQGWGPNQGSNWGSNASSQGQNWGPNGPSGQGWGNHSSNVSESSNTSRGQRNDSPALGPSGKASGPQDMEDLSSDISGPNRPNQGSNWGPPSADKSGNQGPGFSPNVGPPQNSNWGPNQGKDRWGSNKDDFNKGWTNSRDGPDNDQMQPQRQSQWGPPNRGPQQQRPESFNGPPPGFNENETSSKGNQFNQAPRFNQGNGPNRGPSSNQGPDSDWSTDTFKSMDSGKDGGWTGNRGPNRPPNNGPGWGGPNQGPNPNNQNSGREETWNSNKLNEKSQSFGQTGDNFNSNSPNDPNRNSGWQGSQRFGGPSMGQNQGPPRDFNGSFDQGMKSGSQNFNRSSSQESNQNFGPRLNKRGNQDLDRGHGFDEPIPDLQRKRWPSNQDSDVMPQGRNVGFGFNKSSPDDRPDPSWNGPNMTGPSHGRGSKAQQPNIGRPLLPHSEERNFMQPPPKIIGNRDSKSLLQKPPLMGNLEPKSLMGTPPPLLLKQEPKSLMSTLPGSHIDNNSWNKTSGKRWSQGPQNDNVPKELKDKGKAVPSNVNNKGSDVQSSVNKKVSDAPQTKNKDSPLISANKADNSKVGLQSSEVKKDTPKSEVKKETPKKPSDNKEEPMKPEPNKLEDKKEAPVANLSVDKETSKVSEDKKESVKVEAAQKDKTVTTPVQPKPELTISTQAQTRATGSILALFRQRAQEGGASAGIPGLDLPKEDKDAKEKLPKDATNPQGKPPGKQPGKQPTNKNLPPGKDGTVDINFAAGRLNIGPIGVKQNASNWKPPGEWYEDEEENDQYNLNESGSAFNDNRRLSMKRAYEDGALGRPANKMSRFSDAPGLLEGHLGQLPGPHAINFGGPVGPYGGNLGPRQPFGPRGFAPEPFGGPMRGGPGEFNMGNRGGRGGNRGRGRGGRPESLMNMDMDFASDASFNRNSFFELGPSRRGIPNPSNIERYPFFELGASDTDQPLPYDYNAGEPPDRRLSMGTPVPKIVDYAHGNKKADIQEKQSIVETLPMFGNKTSKVEELVTSSNDQTESCVPIKVQTVEKPKIVVPIDDLISIPGRFMRPPKLVTVLRGLPGAGKSTIAQMIKNKEVENGGSAPRILCLDDYFMVESEKLVTDSETGRKIKTKIMEYEYEPELEDNYRAALVKSFKKQVDEGFFPFIIIDCVNSHTKHYKEMCDYAKKNEFEVYIGDVEVEVQTCFQRNIHNRSLEDLQKIADLWEKSPMEYFHVNLTDYIQDANIQEVKMEDCPKEENEDVNMDLEDSPADEEEDKEAETFKVIKELMKSKWDTDQTQGDTLDKLDGIRSAKKRMGKAEPQSIEDWLQLSESFKETKAKPGQKTVRWADIEERREQLSARNRGFVVGQTDWQRMTDPTLGSNALVQIKYIEAREK